MKKLWVLLDVVISILIGFYINRDFTSRIVVDFIPTGLPLYMGVFALCVVIQAIIIFSIIRWFRRRRNKKLSR